MIYNCGKLLYIISTAVRSGLPDDLLYWVCHGVVRLVSSNGYILFPRPGGWVYSSVYYTGFATVS